MIFIPTRAAGMSSLIDFVPRAGRDYARLRNSDLGQGQHNHVSNLSPYIRHRLITEREVVDATLQSHGAAHSEKFIQEVFWRTYFKGWLNHRPQVWTRYQASLLASLKTMKKDKSLREAYNRAIIGDTGIDCFDYWTRELIDTGYLHNHARMWFASIWIFTLKLPWELGADFFLRHLIDGDAASNTLSWRWVGGLHTKGKAYLARPDNIALLTNNRFNPLNQLATHVEALTEPEDVVPDKALPQIGIVPNAPFLLLVHEDDCHPKSLISTDARPCGVVGALATSLRSPLDVDSKVTAFARAAVNDGLRRSDGDGALIEGDWAAALIIACRQHGVRNIVTAHTPIGPSAQALADAMPDLVRAGIDISQIMRPWDRFTWPHANRGFFKVKKKIPTILEDLHLNNIQGQMI